MPTKPQTRIAKTRACVLVVDDDPDMLETAKMMLQPLELDVDTAADGILGLQAARAKAYDVVVLDINMPRMDGIGLGNALRADPSTSASQIVVQTSLVEDWVRQRFAGYDAFVSKPQGALSLTQAVLRVLHYEAD